jgi:plastocyanin
LVPLFFAACGDGGGGDAATAEAASDDAINVVMELVAFKPETLTVDAGSKVIWQQKDAGAHTVTSGTVEQGGAGVTQQPDNQFDSGEISKGDTFEFTFSKAGTYPYFCRLHPATMRGEIQVR